MIRILVIALGLALPLSAHAREGERSSFVSNAIQTLEIYMVENGQQIGPLSGEEFIAKLGSSAAAASTYVWMSGMEGWAFASTVPALQPLIATLDRPAPPDPQPPQDPATFMTGLWVTEEFILTLGESKYDAVIQMDLAADGTFDGTMVYRKKDSTDAPIRMSYESGTWTATPNGNGSFEFARKINWIEVIEGEVADSGVIEKDTFQFTVMGADLVNSDVNISAVRLKPGSS